MWLESFPPSAVKLINSARKITWWLLYYILLEKCSRWQYGKYFTNKIVNISASSYPTTYDKDWIEIESRNRRRIHVLSLENLSCLCFGNIQKMKDYNHQLIRSIYNYSWSRNVYIFLNHDRCIFACRISTYDNTLLVVKSNIYIIWVAR